MGDDDPVECPRCRGRGLVRCVSCEGTGIDPGGAILELCGYCTAGRVRCHVCDGAKYTDRATAADHVLEGLPPHDAAPVWMWRNGAP